MGESAVQLRDLTRDFSIGVRGYKLRALDKLNLEIPSQTIFGLLGPNGSGKSTTLKIILGLLKSSSGDCRIFGVPAGDRRARSQIGFLPENPFFYQFLTGRELVCFLAGISGLRGGMRDQRVEEVLNAVGMSASADHRIRTYSKGMLQRIGLAQALVHEPEILVLDEPMSGLDPLGTNEFLEILKSLRDQGKTVLLASHLLSRVEEICDEIAILDKGSLVRSGSVHQIVQDNSRLILEIEDCSPEREQRVLEILRTEGIHSLQVRKGRTRLDEVFLEAIKPSGKNEQQE